MGGGRTRRSRSTEAVSESVRAAQADIATSSFESSLSNYLADLLTSINARNTGLVSERLSEIRAALEDEIEESVDQLFGGSVAKHTYIEGLSDIDSMLILNDTALENSGPQTALERVTQVLQQKLVGVTSVSHGQLATTVEYPDGMQIQLLPSIRVGEGLKIPSSNGSRWSEIEPTGFREALTKANESCGGRLIPTIKLAKTIVANLPESQRLSGYHVESLAVAAFRQYQGTVTTSAMLPEFFERASTLVLNPITDRTGQSLHVDEYLGGENSQQRQNAKHCTDGLPRRLWSTEIAYLAEPYIHAASIPLCRSNHELSSGQEPWLSNRKTGSPPGQNLRKDGLQ